VSPFNERYKHPFSYHKFNTVVQGNNVIAKITGIRYPEKYIVLTAHYDHLGGKNGNIYNGADDNASGSSALLNFAKALVIAPLDHSVIFLFTDGEESNLKGAKAFNKQQHLLFNDIKLNINLDMLSGSTKTKKLRFINRRLDSLLTKAKLEAFENPQFTELPMVKGFKATNQSLYNRRVNWDKSSDHWVFHQQGIPFVYYGVGTHSNYHKKSDNYDNSNLQFFFKAVNAIYQQLLFLDKEIQTKP